MANGPLDLVVKGGILMAVVLAIHGEDKGLKLIGVFWSITLGPRANGWVP